jgi:hypothetical protein
MKRVDDLCQGYRNNAAIQTNLDLLQNKIWVFSNSQGFYQNDLHG